MNDCVRSFQSSIIPFQTLSLSSINKKRYTKQFVSDKSGGKADPESGESESAKAKAAVCKCAITIIFF